MLADRLAKTPGAHRPFVDHDADVVVQQAEERYPLYDEIATIAVDVSGRTPEAIATHIIDEIEEDSGG
jgi:hypothetical protein